MNKIMIITRHILSIIFVLTFLCVSTLFAFYPKHEEMAGAASYLGRLNGLAFVEISDKLGLTYSYPVSDGEGLETDSYNFQVVNNGSDTPYQVIFLTGEGDNRLPQSAIHYVVARENEEYSEVRTLSEDGIIIEDVITSNEKVNYSFKFWVHDQNDDSIMGTTFEAIMELQAVK